MERKPLAVVTGASTGIGYELAQCCARSGFDLVVAADEPQIHDAAERMRASGAEVKSVDADLATTAGVDELYNEVAVCGKDVDVLIANAGRGLGEAYFDQDFGNIRHVVDTNVTGTLYLLHRIGRDMRERRAGRILITGSIAGFMPGPFNAVYNASKAFLDSFAAALRNELKDRGVSVTCLMPGATETEFFKRAGLLNTALGQSEKDDAGEVAKAGFDAMMKGQDHIVTGWQNKMQVAVASVAPAQTLAEMHRDKAAPGSANE